MKQSTETRLDCWAYGGTRGGHVRIEIRGADGLVQYGGSPLPFECDLEPGEEVTFKNTYRAVRPSGGEDAIVVTATFTENETDWSQTTIDKATAIRLRFTPEVEAPQNESIGRHRYGVYEIVNCFQNPASPRVEWQTTGCTSLGNMKFRLPLSRATEPITASCEGTTYTPALVVVEPDGIEGRCLGFETYGVQTNHAGGIGMYLGFHLKPFEVSFSGLMFEEVPCDRGSHSGYFSNPVFSDIWCHSSANGAGRWHSVSADSNRVGGEDTVDTVAIESDLPRMVPDGSFTNDSRYAWANGHIEWEIPCGWNAADGEPIPHREFATDTRHRLELDTAGTVRLKKLGNEVIREINGTIFLNGERKDSQ